MSGQLTRIFALLGILIVIGVFNESLFAQKIRLRSQIAPPCREDGVNQPGWKYADIYADGNIAVQGTVGCHGVFIFDITNPDAPVLASWYNPGSNQQLPGRTQPFHEAIVVGNRGYFGAGVDAGVHIVDLTNPYQPVLLGVVDRAHGNGFDRVHEMVVEGNYLIENFNGTPNRILKFINISNPANPVFVRDLVVTDPGWIHAMHVRGNRMITSGFGSGNNRGRTEIYDITNIETQPPVLLGYVEGTNPNPFEDNDMHSSWTSEDGNYLYSCRELGETPDLRVYDIHNPAQPVLVKTIETTDLGLNAYTPHNPVVMGNKLYVSWYTAGLQVFDISNPANPVRIGQYDSYQPQFAPPTEDELAALNSQPWDIFCGSGSDSLQNNAAPPGFDGNWAVYPFLGEDKIVAGDMQSGLLILDVTRINAPLENQVSDFDGDRKTDFSVYTPSDGTWKIENGSNGAVGVTQFGIGTDKIEAGDFDGDNKSDIAVFRPGEGVWYVLGSTRGFFAVPFGANGDIPVAGDYDADGKTDFAVFRPSNGTWYILQSIIGFRAVQWGTNGDKPLVGDYEGDGKVDLTVFRPSNGTWYILQSSSSLTLIAQFGVGTDKPLSGDFDGDNKTDLAVYRPGEGNWYVLNSQNNSLSGYRFGVATDTPIPADYDGDGKTDVAVFRAADNAWYRLNSSNGAFHAKTFGQNGDVPSPTSAQP